MRTINRHAFKTLAVSTPGRRRLKARHARPYVRATGCRAVAALLLAAASAVMPAHVSGQSLQEGLRAVDQEQYDLARTIFRTLLSREESAELHFHAGRLYLVGDSGRDGRLDSARFHFERGLGIDPRSGLNHAGLGAVEMARGDINAATAHFDEAKRLTKSKNASVFYHIGLAYMQHETNDPKAAAAALEQAVALDAGRADYYVALGSALERAGDASAAAINYERAARLDPGYAAAHVHSGMLYVRARNYGEAMRKYQDALAADSTYAPAHRALSELYFLAKQYDRAVAHYRMYIERTGATPEKRFVLAGYLYLNEQYAESLEALQGLDRTLDNPVVHRLLAYNYLKERRHEEGLREMQFFFERSDSSVWLATDFESLGRLQLAAGADTLAGIDYLRRAMAVDTSRWILRRDIAAAHLGGGRYDEAAAEYEAMVLEGRTLSATDHLNLGKAYYFGERFGEADSAFARVTEIADSSPLGWLWRGRASARLDSTAVEGRGVPFYERYIELTADTTRYRRELVEAHYHLAVHFYVREEPLRMQEHVDAVLALDPRHEQAIALRGM